MKKRLTALVIVLAMLISVMPFGVVADEGTDPASGHTDAAHKCEHCGQTVTWTPWGNTEEEQKTLPAVAAGDEVKHYYLTENVNLEAGWNVFESVVLCLNGHDITQTTTGQRVINIQTGGNLTITDCTAHEEDGVYVAGSITKGSGTSNGAGIWISRGAAFTLYDGIIEHNAYEGEKGGAVCVYYGNAQYAGGVFNMHGGEISNNGTSSAKGGAVYVYGGAASVGATTFNMDGGTIRNNTAKTGGAIYTEGNAVVEIKNSTISDNVANSVGAINVTGSASVTLTNTSITGNKTKADPLYCSGAVNVQNGTATLKLTGTTVIYDNTNSAGAQSNLHLIKGETIVANVNELTEGAKVGVTLYSARINAGMMYFSTELGDADPSAYCYSDSDLYRVKAQNGRLTLVLAPEHEHCVGGETNCEHEQLGWSKWTNPDALPTTAGSYYLDVDVELTGAWGTAADIDLCLNGHSITQTAEGKRVIGIVGGTLTITDCAPSYDADGNYIGGTISGGNDSKQGDSIWVNAGAVFNLYGGRIENNAKASVVSGAINVYNGSEEKAGGTFNMYGGEICNNGSTTNLGGGVYVREYAAANLYGGTISGNTAKSGGGVYVCKNAVVNLAGVVIENNTAADGSDGKTYGGGVYLAGDGAVVTMTGGAICGNRATAAGGGVILMSGSTFIMNDGTIADNTVDASGAGLFIMSDATFTMEGGTLSGNAAGASGGALYVSNGSDVTISGGTITGNTATVTGGGVCAASQAVIGVSGDVVITGNTVGGAANNLYLDGYQSNNAVLNIGTMGENAKIGLTAKESPRAISGNEPSDCTAYFVSDSPYRRVQMKDKKLYLVASGEHLHCTCANGAAGGCDHSVKTWAAWESTTTLPAAPGNYYLTGDVELQKSWSVSSDITLCLNGHTINQATDGERVISVQSTGKLTITDCAKAYDQKGNYVGGIITGGDYVKGMGSGIWVARGGGELNLYGGRITGNQYTGDGDVNYGGAIYLQSGQPNKAGGVFNMYGGEIVGNAAALGGAVYLHGDTVDKRGDVPATFNMYGGTISGNTAASGGGVYACNGAVVNMAGGAIKNNAAKTGEKTYGGGVYLTGTGTVMTMTGGEISGNTAITGGGGVYLAGCSFILKNGTIKGNTADSSGAGMLVGVKATLTMEGGSFTGNKANMGGGLYLFQGSASFSGGTISGNTANKGGGMWIAGSEVTLSGTSIKGNSAGASGTGGGVGIGRAGTSVAVVTMTGGEISGNTAKAGGGVFTQLGANFTLRSGAISGNTATASGAGVFTNSDTVLVMEGGKIEGNKAANNGGGLYLLQSKATFSGGTVNGNYTGKNGGGMWIAGSETTFSGTVIKNNKTGASGTGGGVGAGGAGEDKSVITMTGGAISGNTARAGGGVLTLTGATFNLKNGSITGNTATASGAGVFASTNSVFNMSGGTVSNNNATSGGGGMYLLQIKGTFSGGSISNNFATNSGGGIWAAGCELTLSGVSVKNNSTGESGTSGGIGIGKAGTDVSVVTMTAGEISGNISRAGAGVLLQPDCVLNLAGGSIDHNEASASGGGIFASNDSTLNMTGGKIAYNTTVNHGAGIYQMKNKATYSGGEICNNVAAGSGGAMMIAGAEAVVTVNGTAVHDNSAKNGGGMVVQSGATLNIDGSELYKNTASAFGGCIYLSTKSFMNVSNAKFYENTAGSGGGAIFAAVSSTATMTGTQITGNTSNADGGGLVARGNFSIQDSQFTDNTATANGGGLATGKAGAMGWGIQPGLVVQNTTVSGNTAGGQGGGVYLSIGSKGNLSGTTITGNKAGTEGGGLWAVDDLTMTDLKVTGNTAGTQGGGVYLSASSFDGHSYFTGLMKMSGDMQICDNNGGNLYMGEKTALVVDGQGLAQNAKVDVTLDSGLLTNRVYGSYNYEGGNCAYTITYGDRSITDPEYQAEQETEQPATDPAETTEPADDTNSGSNAMIYVGIAAFVIVIAALAVVLVLAKNKKKETTGK